MKEEVEAIKNIANTITDKKKVYFEIGVGTALYTFGNETFLNEMIETFEPRIYLGKKIHG